ncbi:MAG: mRNA surveillance protein pelota, partial [Halobacteriaceae archaeon]
GGEREHLHVTLEVEETEFAKFANRLRISGIITDTSREDVIGSHHTINVEAHDEIAIQKAWQPDQLDRLEEAREASENPDVVIVTVEEGEAHIHTVAQYGVEERTSFTGTTGKGEFARDRSELFASIGEALTHLDVDAIILAGPGFTKQDVYDYIESNYPDLTDMITLVDASSVGGRGVHEVLKRGDVEDVQQESRISEEATLIDELRREIADGDTAVYGIDAVQKAADYGAIEHLLILDERLRRERGEHGDWDVDINELITSVEQKGGEVTVFSHEFSPGQQLQNLGGIAALLRYRID